MSSKEGFLIIVGPTGVGKTSVAHKVASKLNGEIVSADSRLFYRMMDIGTAKPPPEMRSELPYHLIDIVDPDQIYTCKHFETQAREIIKDITKRGKVAVVVGGSGLYVRALTRGIFEAPGADPDLRRELCSQLQCKGIDHLWMRLATLDPEKASLIDRRNPVRVIRALEVCILTGKQISELEKKAIPFEIPSLKIGITMDRRHLYRAIDRRVDLMIQAGFVEEVKNLMEMGFHRSQVLTNTLGYRELISHLEGKITLEEATELLKRRTRNFAKRQMTWFRKETDIHWLDITDQPDQEVVSMSICEIFDKWNRCQY